MRERSLSLDSKNMSCLKFGTSLLILLAIVAVANCGSPCPNRSFIYPCHCTSVPITKKVDFTVITCRHLPSKITLESVYGFLRSMQIDRFVLYDSFWEAEKLEAKVSDHQKKLPQNWISQIRIKEMEIVDSKLSPCFACDITSGCPNMTPISLNIHNSSSDDSICTLCDDGTSWLNCLGKMKEFHFVFNKLKAVPSNFFPLPMKELTVVNMSNNQIRSIEKDAFEKIPKMQRLDLSHNMITDISKGIFGVRQSVLTHLDLSFNFIKRLSVDIFKMNPYLVHFYVRNNELQKLPEDDWKHLSTKIRTIDLQENPIECDCHLIWVNCTLHINAVVLGNCVTPGFEATPIRRASKYMSERCVEGVITNRVNKTSLNACIDWNKTHQMDALASMPKLTVMTNMPKPQQQQSGNRRTNQRRN